jgi:CheY-like chemotaxis protein
MKRILLVDDDDDIVFSLVLLLEDQYEVTTARNGAEALRLVQSAPFDAILLDLLMPVLDGAGFMRAFRGSGAGAPVVLVSADIGLEARALELGAADWIAKPFDVDALLEKVGRAAGRGNAHYSPDAAGERSSPP